MIQFNLNGQAVEFELDGPSPLINVLRDHFGLFGTRFGCGQESCGACIVLIDGKPSYSCSVGVDEIASRSVQTVEGQCGFCLSGMLMQSAGLLNSNKNPNESDIRAALQGNLCRCGVHNRIIRAVLAAAEELRSRDTVTMHG